MKKRIFLRLRLLLLKRRIKSFLKLENLFVPTLPLAAKSRIRDFTRGKIGKKNHHSLKAMLAVVLLVVILVNVFSPQPKDFAQSATYTFAQTSWAGGATTTVATHTSNQSGWTYYNSASTSISAGSTISVAAQPSGWVAQNSGVNFTLTSLDFTNSTTGWVVGLAQSTANNVLHTTNGGTTWTAGTAILNLYFSAAISCVSTSTCFVGARGSSPYGLAKTTNGTSWSNMSLVFDTEDVSALDVNNVWVSGGSYTRTSTDGGVTFGAAHVTYGGTGTVYDIQYVTTSSGYALNSKGVLVKTIDNWVSNSNIDFYAPDYYGFYFLDMDTGWIVGVNGVIKKTTNGGSSWTTQTTNTTTALVAIHFADSNTGWAVGVSGAILYTSNGGTTWTAQNSGVTATLYDVFGIDSSTVWAVGTGGTILSYVNALPYPTSAQTLVSSKFDSTDSSNILSSIQWTSSTPANTSAKFQIRTASTADGLDSASWCGPDDGVGGSCSSSTYFTNSAGGETLDDTQRDGSNDRFFQYKVILQTTDGLNTPSASNVTVTYVVNATPEVQNVLASQSASGTVAISYQARDADTNSGTYNPGFVSSTFAYLDAEGAYQTIPSNELTAGAMINQPVATSTYTTSTLVWTPPAGLSVAASRIRVTINDNELANNTASANSATFLLDSVSPVVSSTNSVIVDASSTPAFLTLSASDTSTMQMRISLNSDMSGSSWVA